MTFEFMVACSITQDSDLDDVREFLVDVLTDSLESIQTAFSDDMLQIHHVRVINPPQGGIGDALIGFALDLEDNFEGNETVVEEFTGSLQGGDSPFSMSSGLKIRFS